MVKSVFQSSVRINVGPNEICKIIVESGYFCFNPP